MKKRLERDKEGAVLAGVMGGLANYFKQDPALFRLFAICFLILTGFFPGILLYLAGWVTMPNAGAQKADYVVSE